MNVRMLSIDTPEKGKTNRGISYSGRQWWYYFSRMRRDEASPLECFDTATDGRTRYTAHSGFINPHAPAGTPLGKALRRSCAPVTGANHTASLRSVPLHSWRGAKGPGAMKRVFSRLGCVALGLVVTACASNSNEVASKHNQEARKPNPLVVEYVVPGRYQNHSCSRLNEERERLAARIKEVESTSEFQTEDGIVHVAALTVILTPVSLVVALVSPTLNEWDDLKYEDRTVLRASIKKDCEWSRDQQWPSQHSEWRFSYSGSTASAEGATLEGTAFIVHSSEKHRLGEMARVTVVGDAERLVS
jgi:hypothetical protein